MHTAASQNHVVPLRMLAILLAMIGLEAQAADAFPQKIERLLREHQLIRMVNADVDTARKQVSVESSAYYPRFTLQGNTGTEYIDRDTGTSGNFKPREISAQFNQLLTDFGATSARVDAARTVADKEGFERDLQIQNLLLAAVEAQLKLIRAQKTFSFAKESEANVQRQTQLESARVEAGRGYATDVLQAKAQLAGAEARRVRAELQLAEAVNRYKAVFGEQAGDIDALQGLDLPAGLLPAGEAALDQAVLEQNPDTQAALARQRVASAERRAQVSREVMPRVDLLLSHSKANEQDGAAGKKNDSRAMVRLNWNFDLGLRAMHVSDATLAALESATAKTDYVRVQASEEARSAWANWQMSKQRAGYLDNQVQISANFLDLARRERELGRRSLLDLLNGETSLINARSDAMEAHIDETIASFRVMRAAGRLEPGLFSQPGVLTDTARWGMVTATPTATPAPVEARSSAPETPVPTPAPAALAVNDAEKISGFVETWRTAWERADLDAYLGSYSRDFQPAKGLTRDQWEAQRRSRIRAGDRIKIELGKLKIEPTGQGFSVDFDQRYRSARLTDHMHKQLVLQREGDRLVIVQENEAGKAP
ncbi:MAG: Outer rane efflux protein [Proteobacteria bacterium]|nr:Outer rane efflux protein [Pseudomonadota bacterium]